MLIARFCVSNEFFVDGGRYGAFPTIDEPIEFFVDSVDHIPSFFEERSALPTYERVSDERLKNRKKRFFLVYKKG